MNRPKNYGPVKKKHNLAIKEAEQCLVGNGR